MESNEEVLKMQELLKEKKAALDIIYNMTVKQQEDIEKNEGENLKEYIDKKQEQIDRIDNIDELFEDTFNKFKKELNIESVETLDFTLYPGLKTIKELTEKIVNLGKKTMEIEIENKEKLTVLIENIKSDINQVKAGKKSIHAYDAQTVNIDGVYIDKKK